MANKFRDAFRNLQNEKESGMVRVTDDELKLAEGKAEIEEKRESAKIKKELVDFDKNYEGELY